jgi:hypothetical protein
MEVKCVVPGEKGNTIRGEKKNDPYTVLTIQRFSQPQIGQLAELVDATVGRHHSIKTV